MKPAELPTIPKLERVVEGIAADAELAGQYPQIFDDEHIPATIHRFIELSGMSTATNYDKRRARRQAYYHVGLFMQNRKLI